MTKTIIGLILAAVIIIVGYNHISARLSDYMDNGETWPIDLEADNYISKDFRADDFLYDMAKGYVDGLYEDIDATEATAAEETESVQPETLVS